MTVTSKEGRNDPMPFDTFEDIVRTSCTQEVAFIYGKEGARRGLPPDVLTVMFGDDPDKGLWWNVRRGEIPERAVYEEVAPNLSELDKAMLEGKARRLHGPQRKIDTRPRKRLLYLGWRAALAGMLRKGVLRPGDTLRHWLGEDEYHRSINKAMQADSFMTMFGPADQTPTKKIITPAEDAAQNE